MLSFGKGIDPCSLRGARSLSLSWKGWPHMNLKLQLPIQKQRNDLTLAERAKLSCDLAKQFEKAGDYAGACEALAEFWPDRNLLPRLEGIDERSSAHLLLRCGTLSGSRGSTEQTECD